MVDCWVALAEIEMEVLSRMHAHANQVRRWIEITTEQPTDYGHHKLINVLMPYVLQPSHVFYISLSSSVAITHYQLSIKLNYMY